ncbi:hypothetical protein VTL71DRAFT_2860 [Oculimacula yallundae]|uniref:Uncharacterized protein n=1 Tax=Oculimacula yallundae TaxID=86028 RepID=A0ABR4C7A0_9HELO
MQFTTLLFSAFVTLAVAQIGEPGNNPRCHAGVDCCYGGHDGGLAGCEGQVYVDNCAQPNYRAAMCFNHGVTAAQCDADCCSISGKVGIGCP